MSPAVVVAFSVVVIGAVIWRASGSSSAASEGGRRRTHSLIRPERRRKARVVPPSNKPAELQIMGQDFLEIPEVRDISENGLGISVPHKFHGHKPTAEVDLILTLHGQGTVKARGAIRNVSYTRTNTATFGVELIDIDEQDRTKIRDYVAQVQEAGGDAVPEHMDDASPAHVAPAKK